jgi:hypothetical protein
MDGLRVQGHADTRRRFDFAVIFAFSTATGRCGINIESGT